MIEAEQNQVGEKSNSEKQWQSVYFWGGMATLAVLAMLVFDIAVGSMLGGDISTIPRTAIGRFQEFQHNRLLGLYHLDLLNLITQIMVLPAYWAIYAALRKVNHAWAGLALVFFVLGTTVFIMGNAALPMLDLSRKYAAAATETERTMLAAAGEALLARGAHGSSGALLAFVLPSLASLITALAMLVGNVFSKATAYLGIVGNALLLVYLVLVTFVPGADKFAVALAMPGGLLLMAWMVLFALRLFRLAGSKNDLQRS